MLFSSKAKPGRILVIEDDWDILEVLKLLLEYEGHQVVTAKHGPAGLVAAAAKPFDLVLMDISMPEMSGIEVAQALRASKRTEDIRIAIHTGLDEHWVRERFPSYDLFLSKSSNADTLVDEIARVLAQPKLSAEERAGRAEPTFSTEQATAAQRLLREKMGLGPAAVPLAAFLVMLGDEIGQLRRIGHTDTEIAGWIAEAAGQEVPPAAVAAWREPVAGRR